MVPKATLEGTSVLMIQKATQEHITIRLRGRKMPSRKNPDCRSKSNFRKAIVSFRNPDEIFLIRRGSYFKGLVTRDDGYFCWSLVIFVCVLMVKKKFYRML
jgi:hypothetical protein